MVNSGTNPSSLFTGAINPHLDLSGMYTNQQRVGAVDSYRKALAKYYDSLLLPSNDPLVLGGRNPDFEPGAPMRNYNTGTTMGILNENARGYKANKSIGNSGLSRNKAMTDYVTGKVY